MGGNWGTRIFLLLVLAVIVGGFVIYALNREPSDYEQERESLSLDTAETLQPWLIGFRISLGTIVVLGLAGLVRAFIRRLEKTNSETYPNEQGIFPAKVIKQGEALVDINRLPDGKAITAVLGGKTGLLLVLLFRYIFRREVPELTQQPIVIVTPHDTSPEQLAVTDAAQRAQLASAVFGGSPARPPAAAVQALLPPATNGRRAEQQLPPMLAAGSEPREVHLLLQAARQQWDTAELADVVDVTPEPAL